MKTAVAALLTAATVPAAHAGFYVTDAPAMASAQPMVRPIAQERADAFKVPFLAKSTQITRTAHSALEAILAPALAAASVTITGCGDPRNGDLIAYKRAAAIKAWLIDNDVDPSTILVKTDSDNGVIRSGRLYNCQVAVSKEQPSARPYASVYGPGTRAATQTTTAFSPPKPVLPVKPGGAYGMDSERAQLIRQVLTMVQGKAITAEQGIQFIDQVMKAATLGGGQTISDSSGSEPSRQPAVARPHLVATGYAPEAAPVVPPISVIPIEQTWQMASKGTLKQTVSDWAKAAGWKEPVWNASNAYEITQGATLRGDFMDAMRTVANAVPMLDIKANPSTRELVITDAGR
ncbi:hypothetical protein DBB29_00820 [Pandoraea cepalis]|uniref:Toxin co-regulated pilus biosynthesis protein Q C-terminal domain-containing protein n=1 Tax=Pandoraea cepalis TaxID=2508294 RepID=A0AAW7MHB0_9BURK|nr:TcpQ domain-containing protein [Pandoraea cepalis]MDN4572025.1 hypothetical protein [Pandoraea cepalis]MDN4576676.1 hypothetical protein [Pandoraea cepalis]